MRVLSHGQSVGYAGVLLALCYVLTGCAALGGAQIHKSARGSVQLREVPDWSFEASHPVIIDHMTMLKVVKGVSTDETMPASTKMPASGSKPMRAFSDEDAEFLAPLLAQGLSQAKPEHIVGFTASLSAGSGAEPTAGTLYMKDGALYLTVAFHGKKAPHFAPSTVVRLEKAPSFAMTRPGAMTMVIDYQALAKHALPPSKPIAATLSTTAVPSVLPVSDQKQAFSGASTPEIGHEELDELRQAREINAQKESEIKILRKEAEWMKKKLRERTEELKALRANKVSTQKTAPKKKRAEAHPNP
jgi:hypothetical protein